MVLPRRGLVLIVAVACRPVVTRALDDATLGLPDPLLDASTEVAPLGPDGPRANAAPKEQTTHCDIPIAAPRLLLQVARNIVPHHGEPSVERGAVTSDSECPVDVACVRVPPAMLAALAAKVRAASPLPHGPSISSPHYGGRFIEASWQGGACTLADSSTTPASPVSRGAFYSAFDAIAEAVAARWGDAGRRPPDSVAR